MMRTHKKGCAFSVPETQIQKAASEDACADVAVFRLGVFFQYGVYAVRHSFIACDRLVIDFQKTALLPVCDCLIPSKSDHDIICRRAFN